MKTALSLTAVLTPDSDTNPDVFTDEQRISTSHYTIDLLGCTVSTPHLFCRLSITSHHTPVSIGIWPHFITDNLGNGLNCDKPEVDLPHGFGDTRLLVDLPAERAVILSSTCRGAQPGTSWIPKFELIIDSGSDDPGHSLRGEFLNFPIRDNVTGVRRSRTYAAFSAQQVKVVSTLRLDFTRCFHTRATLRFIAPEEDYMFCEFYVTSPGASRNIELSTSAGVIDQRGAKYSAQAVSIANMLEAYQSFISQSVLADIPTRCGYYFYGIPPSVERLKELEVSLSLDYNDYKVKFNDISIYQDQTRRVVSNTLRQGAVIDSDTSSGNAHQATLERRLERERRQQLFGARQLQTMTEQANSCSALIDRISSLEKVVSAPASSSDLLSQRIERLESLQQEFRRRCCPSADRVMCRE